MARISPTLWAFRVETSNRWFSDGILSAIFPPLFKMALQRKQFPFPDFESTWQKRWLEEGAFHARIPARPVSTPPSRSSTCSICSPTPAARVSMWAMPKATRPRTSFRATSACAASACCIPWAGTRSAFRPSSSPSRPAASPRDDREEHRALQGAVAVHWSAVTTGIARSARRTRSISSGLSGFS